MKYDDKGLISNLGFSCSAGSLNGTSICCSAKVTVADVQQRKPEPQTFIRCGQLSYAVPACWQVFDENVDFGIQPVTTPAIAYIDVRDR